MSKASNKLTAGLRKVQEQQTDASANRARPEAATRKAVRAKDEPRPVASASPERTTGSHPARIWPD